MIGGLRQRLAYLLRKRLGFPLEELALARLRRGGLRPKLVFDVGASHGLFADQAWRIWPDTSIHCFEPEPEYAGMLRARAAEHPRLTVCQALVGATEQSRQPYNFHLGASSVLRNSDGAVPPDKVRHERMITIDGYCREHGLAPDFVKIDVQGYELEVLKGAERALAGVETIFTEVNHIEIYREAPLAAELIEWIAHRGFALHDICNFMPRPRDGALWQTDMIFVRHDSALRMSREW